MLEEGLPDAAFKPIEGDDRNVARALRKQSAEEHSGQHDLFSPAGVTISNRELARRAAQIAHDLPDSLEDLHIHQHRESIELAASAELRQQKLLADTWCAAFVQPKTEETRRTAITQATLEALGSDEGTLVTAAAEELVTNLTRQYRFFHWHIEFPHIFRTGSDVTGADSASGWAGGFSCVIGNPPWERVKLQEQEFFAARSPDIANAPNAAARKKMIAALADSERPEDRSLWADFQAELRKSAGWSHLLRESGRFPLTGRGDVNTYAVFAETGRTVIAANGRAGLVLPTGIATDATTAPFFGDLVTYASLVSFLDFENEAFLLSRAVDHRVRFCLLTVCGRSTRVDNASFAFGTRYIADLAARRFTMPPEEILLVNPNTGTSPVFRTRRDAEITIGIYKHVPILWRDNPEENPWGISFLRMFDMANDAGLFRSRNQLEQDGWTLTGNVFSRGDKRMLPLYEAKMIHYFDHRYGTYEGQTQAQANMGTLPRLTAEQHDDADFVVEPRYWVQEYDTRDEQKSKPGKPVYSAVGVTTRLEDRNWHHGWFLGWRDVCRSSDERTVICGIVPRAAVGHKFPICLLGEDASLLVATWSSFVFDYTARQKITGTSLSYFLLKQLPALSTGAFSQPVRWLGDKPAAQWIRVRVLELSYTEWDMSPFAGDLGDDGAPFHWNEERRTMMRAELDAAYFHLYGLQRDEVEHVMDSFDALQRREKRELGEFSTKRLILERYDSMAEATKSGQAYQTVLDPPPGHGPRHAASADHRTSRLTHGTGAVDG